jgi:branched-chain amino acid transport system substrate-binding protein
VKQGIHIAVSLALCMLGLATSATAAEKIRIGFLSTQSGGPVAGLSKEKREGFDLALKLFGGKLGGLPVEVFSGDDGNNPDVGKQAFDRLAKRDKIDILTGIVTTPVIFSLVPLANEAQVFFLNSNVSERTLGGDKCLPYYFNTGWHVDGINESMGKFLKSQGKNKVFTLGGAWPAGREHIEAFKRGYGSAVAGEAYFKMQTLDFSAELAQIRVAQPDAVYAFAFGPLAVNFMKQYAQAGLKNIPLYGPAPLADEGTVPAAGEAAKDVISSGHWNRDLANEANKKFVSAYVTEYKKAPSMFAEQGYTTVLILDAAVKAVKGKIEDKAAFRKALLAVKLEAPRGSFHFNVDGSPVQNTYLRKVEKGSSGDLFNITQRVIGTNVEVQNAAGCKA